jgi:Tfp pilus assembly protein PilF
VTPEQFAASIAGQPASVAPVVANVETTLATAAAAEARGDVGAARQTLAQHLMLDPTSAVVLRELAHVEDRAGQLSEAERHYRAAIGADPSSAAAVNDLALCQARQGRLESAAGTLRQAILMRPDKPLYRNNLATILVELGKTDEARQQLVAAYEPAVANYNLGLLLARSGKSDAAAASFRDAIALDPSMTPAHEALARVAPARDPAPSPAIAATQASEPVRVASLPTPDPGDITPYGAEESETTPIGPATTAPEGAPSFPRLLPPVVGR